MLVVLLWFSASRASILCDLTTICVFGAALTSSKKIIIILVLAFGASGAYLVAPEIQKSIYSRVVIKGDDRGEIFFSRQKPWQESYKAAMKAGLLGVGYGVSAGHNDYDVGLTANEYGREKGNTQLAVWEEIGLVGLGLYILLLFGICWELVKWLRATNDHELKAMLAIGLGMVLGLTAESAFEAWWVAPGSIQSAGFWAIVGSAAA